jgi:hypothetical protein
MSWSADAFKERQAFLNSERRRYIDVGEEQNDEQREKYIKYCVIIMEEEQ